MRCHRWVLGLGLAVLGMATSATCALAGSWTPEGAGAFIASTNFLISIGTKVDECNSTAGEGTLGAKTSTWTLLPQFSNCTYHTLAEGSWTATDVNSEEATLQIPRGERALVVELSKECSVRVEEGATLGATKDYVNGVNGAEDPSELELAPQSVLAKESAAKCAEVTKVTISANMLLVNLTSLTTPIDVS